MDCFKCLAIKLEMDLHHAQRTLEEKQNALEVARVELQRTQGGHNHTPRDIDIGDPQALLVDLVSDD